MFGYKIDVQSNAHMNFLLVLTFAVPKKASEDDYEDDELNEAWAFCEKQSKSVEVFYRNMDKEKVLTRIHFQFNPDVS